MTTRRELLGTAVLFPLANLTLGQEPITSPLPKSAPRELLIEDEATAIAIARVYLPLLPRPFSSLANDLGFGAKRVGQAWLVSAIEHVESGFSEPVYLLLDGRDGALVRIEAIIPPPEKEFARDLDDHHRRMVRETARKR